MYKDAISLLTSQEKFHIKLGLERVQKLLNYFGNPQDKIKCIHVAGTNGKGSTCAMLESILRHAGYKTGLYTSPHLIEYTERIKINGQDISQDEFAQVIFRVMEQTEPQNIVYYNEVELPVFDGDKSRFNRKIKELYKENFQGKSVNHKILGEIQLTKTGIKKTINTNQIEDLKLIIKIDELIKNGKYIKTELSYKDRVDGIIKFHTLLTKVNVYSSVKNLEIKIGEDKRGRKIYFYKEQNPSILPGNMGITKAFDNRNLSTLPGNTGVTEASDYIIPDHHALFNPTYPKAKIPATEFEILTVAAFVYFFEQNVDFAIMETGLGGRLDATNVIKKPEMSIITSIDIDHADRLGNSIEEIAFEKAGIIKENTPVIVNKDNKGINIIEKSGNVVLAEDKEIETNLMGLWQKKNAALAYKAAELLKIPEHAIKSGLKNVKWPARFQYIESENIIIDAAHNPAGALALRQSLDFYFPDMKRVIVYSSLKTKNYKEVTNHLFRKEDIAILTKCSSPSAVEPELIKENLNCRKIYITHNVKKAVELYKKFNSKGYLTVFTGSIYTIGEIFSARTLASRVDLT
ncbi:MAG: hypothetical protein A2Y25_00960 [Candidatus Melainabacteria bacterium GWF2_37_15]|nr:MAG: hypothetical protein A2Y25_00960 [Candidatus Melainabacteria bacterium GWF2_37_15]